MDTSISVRVFEWRGELHATVDRVGRSDHRKYAHRDRLASFSETVEGQVDEVDAMLWATAQIAGLLLVSMSEAERSEAPAPPGGPQGDVRSTRAYVTPHLRSATTRNAAQTPNGESTGAAGSDGLRPPGVQPSLWDASTD